MNTIPSSPQQPSTGLTGVWEWLKTLFQVKAPQERDLLDSLPAIPDFPNSPVSGWKHFGILKRAEARIHAELIKQKYDGRLVGLRVTYGKLNTANEQEDELIDPYTMSYGYDLHDMELLDQDDDPLSDDFIIELYEEISDLVHKNAKIDIRDRVVSLEANLNPKTKNRIVRPMICRVGQCDRPPDSCIGKWRIMISRDGGRTWRCRHR
ncbi:MAG TPA: hypothetical protein VI524_07780 [Anaerolineales bacterium]|nr:hypothetical protein [Anaerolineales bacterium]